MLAAVDRLRARGVRLAVDDTGMGYASFRHVLRLRPDIIKLDMSLTRDIDRDPARAELTRAIAGLARQLDALLVAEGVESQEELDTLVALGVGAAQGYYLTPPGDLPVPDLAHRPSFRRTLRLADRTERFVSEATATSDSLDAVIQPILRAVVETTDLDSAYLTVLNPDRRWLQHRWVFNAGPVAVPEGLTMRWVDSLSHRCQAVGLTWTAAAAADLPGDPVIPEHGIQTFVTVPVTSADGRTLGTLCALGTAPRYVSDDVLTELHLYSRLVANQLAPHSLLVPAAG